MTALRRWPMPRWGWLALLAAALVFPFAFSDYQVFVVSQVLVYAIAILGLTLLTGLSGQVSIGQGAVFAVGAYAAAITTRRFQVPYLLTIPLGACLGFTFGLGLGIPTIRIRGIYLALVTLAIALVLPPVVIRFQSLTGGTVGLSLPAVDVPPGLTLSGSQWLYLVTLSIAVLAIYCATNLARGRVGRALVAIRQSQLMAAAAGVDVTFHRVLVFAIGSAYGGAAGALYALLAGAVSADAFTVTLSTSFLVAAVVGGVESPLGALIGAAFIVVLPASTAALPRSFPQLVFAAAILAAVYLQPGGLAALANRAVVWSRDHVVRRRREPLALVRTETP